MLNPKTYLAEILDYCKYKLDNNLCTMEEMNSLAKTIHEIIHICQHIAEEDGLDPYGEEFAYLGGDIAREVSDIVCVLSCPHCRGK